MICCSKKLLRLLTELKKKELFKTFISYFVLPAFHPCYQLVDTLICKVVNEALRSFPQICFISAAFIVELSALCLHQLFMSKFSSLQSCLKLGGQWMWSRLNCSLQVSSKPPLCGGVILLCTAELGVDYPMVAEVVFT